LKLEAALCAFAFVALFAQAGEMERVVVAKDGKSFVLAGSGARFVPWGFNYDHDEKGRLIEDCWADEWSKVEKDFARMKKLGANVVRVHLQFGKFMDGPNKANAASLARLGKLLKLAEKERLYLDLTGLGLRLSPIRPKTPETPFAAKKPPTNASASATRSAVSLAAGTASDSSSGEASPASTVGT
jgi:hypothetical protein